MLAVLSFVSPAWASPAPQPAAASATVRIPKQSDWTDRGTALSPGPSGSWDARLTGAITPATVVKFNGVFYLYYIGADGNRSTDGGPRHRALGVATSTDGIHFTKYSANPVITHLPHNNEEEGVFSAGAMVAGGRVILYYGAMDAGSATSQSVDGDIRLAVSSDGLKFSDKGDVVSHADGSVWGSGDELFPVGVHQDRDTTYVYYIAKGGGASWDLGLARGPAPDRLPTTGPALTAGSQVRGGTDPVQVDPNTLAFFIVRDPDSPRSIEVWTAPADNPGKLSGPVETYKFSDVDTATVMLDRSTNTWFMYYRNSLQDSISVKTAPAGPSSLQLQAEPSLTLRQDPADGAT